MSEALDINGGKAECKDGNIHAFIYDQEGNLQPFTVKDSKLTRYFIQWLQRHDRYSSVSTSGSTPVSSRIVARF